ncbi:MAG: hypothetical protein KDK36_07580, partial [Leptospiraceae bacterium]|nr:hypothetical protein [Leptospiraceae bacterium]
LYNLGFSKQFTDHFKGAFFPTLLEKTKHRKEPPELKFFQHYKDNSSFLHYKPERKKLFLTGGGTFDEKPSKIQETVEELFRIFDLDSKKGTFFLRTARNSYFYPLDPENRSRLFYVQEKNTIEIPFHFFYIHCE